MRRLFRQSPFFSLKALLCAFVLMNALACASGGEKSQSLTLSLAESNKESNEKSKENGNDDDFGMGSAPTPVDDTGTVDPNEGSPSPDDVEDVDPPVVVEAPKEITVNPSFLSYGEVETGASETSDLMLDNPSDADQDVSVYLETEGDELTLTDADGKEVKSWNSQVLKNSTLKIPVMLRGKATGKFRGKIIVSLPNAGKGFEIPVSGELFRKILRLESPPKVSYLATEESVLFKGSVPLAAYFTKTATVTLTTHYTDKDGKAVDDKTTTPLTAGHFEVEIPIKAEVGHYTVTASLTDDWEKNFTAVREIIREEAPSFNLSLKTPSGGEVNRQLTDEAEMRAVVDLSNPDTAGLVYARATLNGTEIDTATLAQNVSGNRSLALKILAEDIEIAQGINTLVVEVANRVGSSSHTLTFTYDSTSPQISITSPLSGSFIDHIDDVLQNGLDLKGTVSGIDLAAIANLDIKFDPESGECAADTPKTVKVTRTVSGEELEQEVDPCPLQIYINSPEVSSIHRVHPNADGSFSLKLLAPGLAEDGRKIPGLVFGVNSVGVKATDELGHENVALTSFQLGDIDPGTWQTDGDVMRAIFPALRDPFGLSVNNELLKDSSLHRAIEYALNDSKFAMGFDSLVNLSAGGMKECIEAIKTPFFTSAGGDVGFWDRYRKNQLPKACEKTKVAMDTAMKVSKTCLKNIPDCPSDPAVGIKPKWPTAIFFYDDLREMKKHLTADNQRYLFRKNGDYDNPHWLREHIRKGNFDIIGLAAKDDNHLEAEIKIFNIRGPALLVTWSADFDYPILGRADPYVWPLFVSLKSITVKVDLTVTPEGTVFINKDEGQRIEPIGWEADPTPCANKTFTGDDIALGCSSKDKGEKDSAVWTYLFGKKTSGTQGFFIDASTPWGEDLMIQMNLFSSKEGYEKALKKDRQDLDDYALIFGNTLAGKFQDKFNQMICAMRVDDNLAWCEDGAFSLAEKMPELDLSEKFGIGLGFNWEAGPLSLSEEGFSLGLVPELAISIPVDTDKTETTFPTIYRTHETDPAIPFVSGRSGIGFRLSEQLLNQSFQAISMKGLMSLVDKNSPYEYRVSPKILAAQGISATTIPFAITTTGLLGMPKDEPIELRFYFSDSFAPTIGFDDAAMNIGMGNLKVSAYSEGEVAEDPDNAESLIDLNLNLFLQFSLTEVEPEAGDLAALELGLQSTTAIHTAVIENNTGLTYGETARTTLQGKLNTALAEGLGSRRCLYLGIPGQIPPQKVNIHICDKPSTTAPATTGGEGSFLDPLGLEAILLQQPAQVAFVPGYFDIVSAVELLLKGDTL